MLKAREIINKETRGVPYVMVISYIMDKGESNIVKITDKQIAGLKENSMMTKEFVQDLVRAAREVCRNCTQSDIVQLIKAEWCCDGEEYDPDLGQFVNVR